MAKGKPVELSSGLSFPTKKAATEYFRAMRARYELGERLNEEDSCHMAALLERHPGYEIKVGCGVKCFVVDRSPEYGTPCFRLIRHDGSSTDFSWVRCVDGELPSHAQEVHAAFRHAVRYDCWRVRDRIIADHKSADGLIPCAVSGELVRPDDCRLDHRPPMTFQVLVATFLQANNIRYEDVALTPEHDNQEVAEVIDAGLVERFRRFHAGVAQLDLVEKGTHAKQYHVYRLKPTRARIVLDDVPAYEEPRRRVIEEDINLEELIGGKIGAAQS